MSVSHYLAGVGIDYKSTITIMITVPMTFSITITITVLLEKAIAIVVADDCVVCVW